MTEFREFLPSLTNLTGVIRKFPFRQGFSDSEVSFSFRRSREPRERDRESKESSKSETTKKDD